MGTEFAERPKFFEGQYLGAADLQSLIIYFSELIERHQLASHTWGIAAGIDLVYQASPQGEVEIWLTPGVATDGYGRTIVVTEPFPLDAGLFAGQPAGLVDVWIRYDEVAGQGVRPGFGACNCTDAYSRVVESFLVEVGARRTIDARQGGISVGDEAFADAREAPGSLLPLQPVAPDGSVAAQRFPADGDPDLWLIPVGRVLWQGGVLAAPTPASAKQSRIFRRHAGWIGEALHGTGGLLRLRGRFTPRIAGSTVDQVCDAELPTESDLIYCAADPDSPRFREPIWLDTDTRARGHLRFYGSRTEWVDATGTDYLPPASGVVTALRRTAPTTVKGVDLEVLLGQPQGSNGPTRLTIGAATVSGTDPCAIGFSYVPGVAIQQDGHVGIGTVDKVLDKPLTIRAIGAVGSLVGFETGGGALAWQFTLGASGGLNLTQADPTLTNFFVAAGGNVGIGTEAPTAKLDIQQVASPQNNPVGSGKWLQIGSAAAPDAGQVWFQYGPQLAPMLVLSDLDDPPRIQFQQVGGGNEAAAQFQSWIGQARSGSADLAVMGGLVGVNTTVPFTSLTVQGSLGFKAGSDPMMYLFESGTANADRMIVAHSQAFREWGLQYRDSDDSFVFLGANMPSMYVGLGSQNVGIGTVSPAARLEVRGDIKLGPAGEYFALAATPKLMIVAGSVSAAGSPINGSGFNASFSAFPIPVYTVSFNPPFAAPPIVTATLIDDNDNVIAVSTMSANGFSATIRDVAPIGGDENQLKQTAFCFIAVGLRP